MASHSSCTQPATGRGPRHPPVAPQHHGRAGDQVASEQYREGVAVLERRRARPGVASSACSRVRPAGAPGVDQAGIACARAAAADRVERARASGRELAVVPDVVLVAQRDQVAARVRERVGEVADHARAPDRAGGRRAVDPGSDAAATSRSTIATVSSRRGVVAEHDLERVPDRRMLATCSPRNAAPLWVQSDDD